MRWLRFLALDKSCVLVSGRELLGAGPCKPDGTSLVAGSHVFLWKSGGTFLDDIVVGFENNIVVDIYARDTMWYEALPGIGGIAVGAVIAGGGLLLILFLWRGASPSPETQ